MLSKNIAEITWNIINKKSGKDKSSYIPRSLETNGGIRSDPGKITNELNNLFTKIKVWELILRFGNTAGSVHKRYFRGALSTVVSPMSGEKIAEVIWQITFFKSSDTVGVSTWIIKQCSAKLVEHLQIFINSFSGVISSIKIKC